jgi:CRISPR-associated endoribonuclease Cas6
VHLPPERCGEVLYGAFGTVLRRTACDPACAGVERCPRRDECLYAKWFEPAVVAAARIGRSAARKPFLFRPPLGGGGEFTAHRPLVFELRLFGTAIESAGLFIDICRRFARTGLADRAVDLVSVLSLDRAGTSARILFDDGRMTGAEPIALDFRPFFDTPPMHRRARVEFLTPVLLKDRRIPSSVPAFAALVRRLRDRVSLLCLQWERSEWEAEYRSIGDSAGDAVTSRFDGGWNVHNRHSTRTRRDMPVEGFRGTVFYDAVDPRLWPLLRIGEEIHVGQHAVWGNGRYRLSEW